MRYMLTALLLVGGSALAHEGHDHAEPAAAAAPVLQTRALRINSASDQIELVAIAGERQLDVYLDQTDSNNPIIGARLELEADGKTTAARVEGDHYQLDAPWLKQPGRHQLVFSVESRIASDLLPAQVDIDAHNAKPAPATSDNNRLGWMLGAIVTAAILGPLLALKGRRPGRKIGGQL